MLIFCLLLLIHLKAIKMSRTVSMLIPTRNLSFPYKVYIFVSGATAHLVEIFLKFLQNFIHPPEQLWCGWVFEY
ncbi:hypothetical protein B0H14DRAFT_2819450 [Mycena olivaceomarginata]|nr:hypothetical protein B0H14DRAFT_2819450 [Mycena olivaceomarginata]